MSVDAWTAVDDYVVEKLVVPEAAFDEAVAASAAAGLPAYEVSAPQGKLLELLARLRGARSILEIGTLGGYSTMWLARALPAGGRVVTLELSPKHAAVARSNLANAGYADVVEVVEGPALDSLARLAREGRGPFDMVFIDADKRNNVGYFDAALAMSKVGTLIVIDNVVRAGAVLDEASTDESVQGVRRLNDRISNEPRVQATCIQTVGKKGYDGFTMVVVV